MPLVQVVSCSAIPTRLQGYRFHDYSTRDTPSQIGFQKGLGFKGLGFRV